MKRIDCLRSLAGLVTDELVATTLTGTAWEWHHVSNRKGNIKVGSMGNASAVALGMSIGLPNRNVIALDSDGSVFMDLATLTTIGAYRPDNLSVIVFDNERYSGTNIDRPSPSALGSDIEAIAKGCGIACARTVTTLNEFVDACQEIISATSLQYVIAKVENDPASREVPKPTKDYQEQKFEFWRYIEESEDIRIFEAVW